MVECDGWWQQRGFGRQLMTELELHIRDQQVVGKGVDIIAPFGLAGSIRDGIVELRKSYELKHSVIYVGQYDGEGTFWGTWTIGKDRGKWTIHIRKNQKSNLSSTCEIGPGAPSLF